ncbi:hypothetical protein [Alkaliflexus imshenetskii]|uniref:hypothetical protein n=1 Tax=Alkaliflexus imshenetskii TaxID=286730 RepID=UPI00047CAC01|nr:hypothetical protein [Alkaliflexus imshenetskii]
MKNNKSPYSDIESFSDLENEKMRLTYEVRIARRKMDLAILELGASLNPIRLASSLFGELLKPVTAGIRQWIEGVFSGRKPH